MVCEGVDTVVTCYAAQVERQCDDLLATLDCEVLRVGDALAPRTVEEAVLDGLRAGLSIQ